MSDYYKPHRNPKWNYGGPNWKLSRSKIDLFANCPKCFFIDNKLGTARPPGFPFSLNSAVDALLKKEFDIYRHAKTPHPLMEKYGIDAIPYEHKDIDEWRENFKGIIVEHKPTGFRISGAIDDVWVNPDTNELFVVDYKSTSKDGEVNLDAEWQDGYKRQMEIYQWLFRQNGFKVSDTGYFVYANGRKDEKAFDGKLEFDVTIISYTGKDTWIEETLIDIKKLLDDEVIPGASDDCDFCKYRESVAKVIYENREKNRSNGGADKKVEKKDGNKNKNPDTLF